MRRFLAYVIMMITLLCAVVFNTQAVLENKVDAMEYGTGIELVYSLTKRDAENYDTEKYSDYFTAGYLEDLSNIDIESSIMDRLDTAGVRNASVDIVKGEIKEGETEESGYQLKISLSPLSDLELSNVKEILSFTGSLTIGTEGDTQLYYQSNDEFFDDDDDLAEVVYNGTTPYPVIKVKDAESFDNLKKAAEEASDNNVSEAHRYYADGDEEEATSPKVYLWMNKTLDDTYDKAYGTHETVVMEETKNKVLAEIDVANWDSDNLQLAIATDSEGNAFSISSARAFVNMLNCDDYGFDIEFLYQNNVSATFGQSAINLTYIVFGVVLLVICVLMIVFYGLAGVTSSLTMLASIIVSFFLFSFLGFEFSVAALGGLAIIVALSIMISVNYFERVKVELKRGRDIVKANKEGYHKSFMTSLDVSAIVLISSVFCFLIGTGAFKTFFGVCMVGCIFTFLITNFLNRWMMFWLVKDNANSNLPFFGFKKTNQIVDEEKANDKLSSINSKSISKKTMIILPIVSFLSMAIGFPLGYVLSGKEESFFNNYSDFSSTYVLNIQFNDNNQAYDKLSVTTKYNSYLKALGESDNTIGSFKAIDGESNYDKNDLTSDAFLYYPSTATVNVVEKSDEEDNTYFTIFYSVKVDRDLDDVKDSNGTSATQIISNVMINDDITIEDDEIISPFAGDSHGDKDSLVVGSYEVKATNVAHTSNYLILVSYLITCFVFVYLLVRFGLNISLASLATGTLANTLYLGLLALLRIPYSSYTCFAILIAITILNLFFVPLLGRNKEVLKERGLKKKATDEERADILTSCASKALVLIIPVLAILLVYSFALAFINSSLIGLSIASILFLLLDFVILYLFSVPFYHLLSCKVSFKRISDALSKRREEKAKKSKEVKTNVSADGIVYVDDGPHETIIPGLNDFPKTE